jgi:cell wall-associated NlpC family hydrolase
VAVVLVIVATYALTRAPSAVRIEQTLARLSIPSATVRATTAPPAPPKVPKDYRQRLLATAYRLLGTPYKYGAKGPDAYDCSGFTKAAYAGAGVKLPDGSFNQASGEKALTNPARLVPGDLIFYRWGGNAGVSHVTLYAGEGWVIGTGTPGQPPKVALYPLSADTTRHGDVLTYRHVRLPDER